MKSFFCWRRSAFTLVALVVTGLLTVPAALADTTIGQTGTPTTSLILSGGYERVLADAVVPAGGGTITSFQTESGTCQSPMGFVQGTFDFQVLRPQGNDQYLVLGHTGNQTDACDGQLHSYPVRIPVQAGDVLGGYTVTDWLGALSTGGTRIYGEMSEPAVGDVITVSTTTTEAFRVDESALLVVTRPTHKSQCKHGGWKNFGRTFKNQGSCVSYVASHKMR